jgi:hypothetical protein
MVVASWIPASRRTGSACGRHHSDAPRTVGRSVFGWAGRRAVMEHKVNVGDATTAIERAGFSWPGCDQCSDYPSFVPVIPAVTANRIACSMDMSMGWTAERGTMVVKPPIW